MKKFVAILILIAIIISLFTKDLTIESFGSSAISIGKEKLYKEEFIRILSSEISQIKNNLGYINSEQVNYITYQYLLPKIINNMLITNFIKDLGIDIQQHTIKNFITENVNFQDEKKKFDSQKFQKILDINHISEQDYFKFTEDILIKKFLFSTLFSNKYENKYLEKKYLEFESQVRIFDVIKINKDKIDKKKPTPQEIEEFFNEHKKDFAKAEMRSLKYIDLIDIKTKIHEQTVVDPSETKQELTNNRQHYVLEFTNYDLKNLIFKDKKNAQYFLNLLENEDFDKAMKKIDNNQYSVSELKNIKLTEIEDNISNAVRDLKINEYTDIIESTAGFHIVKLQNIHQEDRINEKIEELIKENIHNFKTEEEFHNKLNQIQEYCMQNLTIEKIAENLKLSIQNTELFNAKGFNTSNKKVILPNVENILQDTFDNFNPLSPQLLTNNNTEQYFVVQIAEILPSKNQELATVHDQVEKAWQQEQINDTQESNAFAIFDALIEMNKKDQINYNALDKSIFYKINYNERMAFDDKQNEIKDIVFNLDQENCISKPKKIDEEYYIFVFKNIDYKQYTHTQKEEKLKKIKEEIADEWADNLYFAILEYARKKYKTKINDKAISQSILLMN